MPERAGSQYVDRRWLWIVPVVAIGYVLVSGAIYLAAQHGWVHGVGSVKSHNLLLGPLNFLIAAPSSTAREHDGAIGFFVIFSVMLVPALLVSFGRSGCLPWLARFAAVLVWIAADIWAWLLSIPLE